MNFAISKKQLFHKIKDKQDGMYPGIHVKSPLFAAYAEEAFFLLCGKEKENICEQDSQTIQVFLEDFVKLMGNKLQLRLGLNLPKSTVN